MVEAGERVLGVDVGMGNVVIRESRQESSEADSLIAGTSATKSAIPHWLRKAVECPQTSGASSSAPPLTDFQVRREHLSRASTEQNSLRSTTFSWSVTIEAFAYCQPIACCPNNTFHSKKSE